MLGRKDYTQDELDNGRTFIADQLAAHDALASAIAETEEVSARTALDQFDPLYFNGLALSLDRLYVHRLRVSAGKDNNALNELGLIVESLLGNGGVFRAGNVVEYVAADSVVGLEPGDGIQLTADQFERLAGAFFADLEERFVGPA